MIKIKKPEANPEITGDKIMLPYHKTGILQQAQNGEWAKRVQGIEEIIPTLYELEQAEPSKRYDIIDAAFVFENGSNAVGKYSITVSLTKKSPEIIIKGTIINKEDGVVYAFLPEKKAVDVYCLEVTDDFQIDEIAKGDSCHLSLLAEIEYSISGKKQNPTIVKDLYRPSVSFEDSNDSQMFTYEHERPSKKKPGQTPEIYGSPEPLHRPARDFVEEKDLVVIVLMRMPAETKDVDYICGWGRNQTKGRPYFGIPCSGNLYGQKGSHFIADSPDTTGTCIIYARDSNDSSGGCYLAAGTGAVKWNGESDLAYDMTINGEKGTTYQSTAGNITFVSSSHIATYSLLAAWQDGKLTYDEEAEFKPKIFDYEMTLNLAYKHGTETKIYTVVITSFKEKVYSADFVWRDVKPLKIMFGCLAKGTLVLTKTGFKPIEEIGIGVVIKDPQHSNATGTVVNTWTGLSNECCKITAGSKSVLLSPEHPVFTPNGFVSASVLRKGMLVVGEGGEILELTDASLEQYGSEVFNLSISWDDGGCRGISANGIIVGDMEIQNK